MVSAYGRFQGDNNMIDLKNLISDLKQIDFLSEQLSEVEKLQDKIYENEIIISVVGQFKRGKSSFVNTLFDDSVLPTGIIPVTSTVTEIRYGRTFRSEVVFNDGTSVPIKISEISDYCSEQGNSENHKNVMAVKLWSPKFPFGRNVVLVDTPGVGSINQQNTDCSYSYVKQSDALVFMLSVDSPISETERDFLIKCKEYAAKFFIAVNKIDNIDDNNRKVFLGYCKKIISECLEQDISVYAVSAKTGEGIKKFTETINTEIKKSGKKLKEKSIENKLDIVIAQTKAKLQLAIDSSSIPTENLAEKIQKIEDKQNEILCFGDELKVLSTHRTTILVDNIKEKLQNKVLEYQTEAETKCCEIYENFHELPNKEFKSKMEAFLYEYLKQTVNKMNKTGIKMLTEGYTEISEALCKKAYEAGLFIADLLKEEFEIEYPVTEKTFSVSEKSDFLLHIGKEETFNLSVNDIVCFLPKKIANDRFYKQSTQQLKDDIQRNKNNMVYNYRYKMQESLLVLCINLTDYISEISSDLKKLLEYIRKNLYKAESQRQSEEMHFKNIVNRLSEY